MKKKLRFIYIFVGVILLATFSYNLYQQNKINSYKRQLTNVVSNQIQQFAGIAGNIDNENVYAEQYASIVSAQEAFSVLSDKKGIP